MDESIKKKLLKHFGLLKKEKFYNIEELLIEADDYDFKFILPLGARDAGKSYQCKEIVLWEAANEASYSTYKKTGKIVHTDRYQFAYVRRWDTEIPVKNVIKYFNSHTLIKEGKTRNRIQEITNDEFDGIDAWQGEIYFIKRDDSGKTINKKTIGYYFSINRAQRYKSLEYLVNTILFEEFTPDDGKYCPKEVELFYSLVSTIERGYPCRKILVGNTNITYSPYMVAWGLKKIILQPPNSIERYSIDTGDYDPITGKPIIIKLIVETTDEKGNVDLSTIGEMRKSISHGIWNIKVYPHLKKPFTDYENHYEILIDDMGSRFIMRLLRDGEEPPFLYVEPYTKNGDNITRVITDKFSNSPFVTVSLDEVTKFDKVVRELVKNKKITFCSDYIGEQFYNLIEERGGL